MRIEYAAGNRKPLVAVGVKTDSHAHPLIKDTKAFALNVQTPDQDARRDRRRRDARTAAGMLLAEQQFRRIIGYRDLAKLVIAVERHALLAASKNEVHQEIAEPITV